MPYGVVQAVDFRIWNNFNMKQKYKKQMASNALKQKEKQIQSEQSTEKDHAKQQQEQTAEVTDTPDDASSVHKEKDEPSEDTFLDTESLQSQLSHKLLHRRSADDDDTLNNESIDRMTVKVKGVDREENDGSDNANDSLKPEPSETYVAKETGKICTSSSVMVKAGVQVA